MTDFYSVLPHLNASLNASSFVLLSSGYYFIKRKRVHAHRNCQLAALTASVVFLISYIVYHAHHGATRFAGQGIARPIYFTILITHTFLAAVIVPFVIITVRRAQRRDFAPNKFTPRWPLPLRMYLYIPVVVFFFLL